MNDTGYRFDRRRRAAIRTMAPDQVVIGRERERIHPGAPERGRKLRLARVAGRLEPPPELRVVRVDVELLAGLGVVHEHRPDVGQLALPPVVQPDRDDLVLPRQPLERPLPARGADEVRDHEHQRSTLDPAPAGVEQDPQIRERRGRVPRMRLQVVDEPQHLDPPTPRRDRPLDLRPVEDRAHLVPVPRQHPGQRRDGVHQHAPLQPLRLPGPEVHRRAQVQQEPGRDLAILEELADVRRVHPRRDVPVDVADVVAVLVLAQVGEIDAVAPEQAPVVALEQAVQPADDRPVESLEDALRRRRGRGHRIATGRPGRAPDR